MNEKKPQNKAVLAVSFALIFVLLLVIAVFVFGNPGAARADITIPDPQHELSVQDDDLFLAENSLLQITPDNASVALYSLRKPEHYHQSYEISVGAGSSALTTQVELWVNGSFICAQVSSARQSKTLLSDGTGIYLWYQSDDMPVYLELGDTAFEDVLGLPAFDYMRTIQTSKITDAEYLVIENEQHETSCIFLAIQEASGASSRYWIDLSTGLLCQADSVEDNEQVYMVKQTSFDRLAESDEVFAGKFLLPDGSEAFIEET